MSGVAHLGPYAVAKAGVVSLSETLRVELAMSGAPIGVSVLCPSATNTNVKEGERNRPAHLGTEVRVYNSALMNILRDEDNGKYRSVMKNTMEFDPEVLKRYVNFMNNPDEKTAVEQFGRAINTSASVC